LNIISKLGLIIIVASLSTLCGNTLQIFGGSLNSYIPTTLVMPGTYAGDCEFLVSYNYAVTINSNATIEFMVIPFNQLFEQYGEHSDHAITNAVVENWGTLTFRPDRRGVYGLVLRTTDSETAMAGVGILATRVFEWDFFYDSLIIAVFGGALGVVGLVVERVFKRGRTT